VQFYGAKVAAAEADLPTCDSATAGQLFYVLDASEFQFCTETGYVAIDLAGTTGTDGADGANGSSGVDGTDGAAGTDGTSCTVAENTNGTKTISCEDGTSETVSNGQGCTVKTVAGSYELTCGVTTVVVRNGTDGVDGSAGIDGTNGSNGQDGSDGATGSAGSNGINCTVEDDGLGTIIQTCGADEVSWPKALCGLEAYDPLNKFCDTRDNQTYSYKVIGTGATAQTWMAENLNYATASGSWCKSDVNTTGLSGLTASSTYCDTYGRVYNWATAKTSCPTGWSLPDDAEWTTLETFVDASGTVAGTKLKAASGWNTGSGSIAGTDEFGFSALPGGSYNGSVFYSVGSSGYWWTATPDGSIAYYRYMNYIRASVYSSNNIQNIGFAVRCLQD
jgi:uncharacterized protein (TIGR02145 family)